MAQQMIIQLDQLDFVIRVKEGMNKDIRISLVIRHPYEDIFSLVSELNIKPFRVWVSGDKRETPKGRKLTGRHKESYCCLRGEINEQFDLSGNIALFLNLLAPINHKLNALVETGGSMELLLYNVGDNRLVDKVEFSLIARLSKLKISLCFDL